MRVNAFLLRSGTVEVRSREAEMPEEYAAYMDVDGGVVEDWPFLVRMAEARMLATYIIADAKAVKIERHCGGQTFKLDKKRFDVNGELHVCKNRRKK